MKDQLIFVDRLSLQVFKMFKKWRYAVIIRALMGAHGIEGETPNLRFSHLAILTGQTDSKNLLSLPLPRCLCGKNVSSGILKDRCMSRVCACADCARHAFQIPRPALSQSPSLSSSAVRSLHMRRLETYSLTSRHVVQSRDI